MTPPPTFASSQFWADGTLMGVQASDLGFPPGAPMPHFITVTLAAGRRRTYRFQRTYWDRQGDVEGWRYYARDDFHLGERGRLYSLLILND